MNKGNKENNTIKGSKENFANFKIEINNPSPKITFHRKANKKKLFESKNLKVPRFRIAQESVNGDLDNNILQLASISKIGDYNNYNNDYNVESHETLYETYPTYDVELTTNSGIVKSK